MDSPRERDGQVLHQRTDLSHYAREGRKPAQRLLRLMLLKVFLGRLDNLKAGKEKDKILFSTNETLMD